MTRICKFIVLTTSFFFAFSNSISWASTHKSSEQAKKVTVNIGIYAPFSEQSAYIGRNLLAAMEMGQEQLKSSEINYSFYTLDESANSRTEKTLAKFIQAHQINVLVTQGKDSGKIAAYVAKKHHLIHFSMAEDASIADGENNFLAKNPSDKQAVKMDSKFINQFQEAYLNYPSSEAGYAFAVFHILHQSTVLALHDKAEFSSKHVASQIHSLASRRDASRGVHFDQKGVLYAQAASEHEKSTV